MAQAAEAYNIYLPTYAESGELVALELVEPYEIRSSDVAPPLGARLMELEHLTGIAHLSEPVEMADKPKGLAAKAAEGQAAVADAEVASTAATAQAETERAAQEQAVADAQQSAAKERIAQLLDPEGVAKLKAQEAINAEHGALEPFASNAEKTRLAEVKDARLAALESAK